MNLLLYFGIILPEKLSHQRTETSKKNVDLFLLGLAV